MIRHPNSNLYLLILNMQQYDYEPIDASSMTALIPIEGEIGTAEAGMVSQIRVGYNHGF